MQTHTSQQFRNVLQNPLVTLPIFMFLLRAAHSWFNQVKSPFGVKKSLLSLSPVWRVCPPMLDASSSEAPWFLPALQIPSSQTEPSIGILFSSLLSNPVGFKRTRCFGANSIILSTMVDSLQTYSTLSQGTRWNNRGCVGEQNHTIKYNKKKINWSFFTKGN